MSATNPDRSRPRSPALAGAAGPQVVRGRIHFDPATRLPPAATAYVRILDTTECDAPSTVLGEQVIRDIGSQLQQGLPLRFGVEAVAFNANASLRLNVLVDVDGDGQVGRGDFITMQSYPVLTYGYPDEVDVVVRQVQ